MLDNIRRWLRRRSRSKLFKRLFGGDDIGFIMPWEPSHPFYSRNRLKMERAEDPWHDRHLKALPENNAESFYVHGNGRIMSRPFKRFVDAANYITELQSMQTYEYYRFEIRRGSGVLVELWRFNKTR